MSRLHPGWPASTLVSVLAALTTWTVLWAWSGFAEQPSGYLAPILGGCLLVALTGIALRAARVPSVLVALGQVAVLAVWLNHRWAGDLMLGGLLPTPASLHQVVLTIETAAQAAQSYAAPVPRTVPEFYPLLIFAGAATAVLVDFLACGLRRVPLAGLPLLALYTAPVSILDGGVSWFKFAVGALAFLSLLAGDEAQRLSRWGGQLSAGGRLFDSQSTEVSNQAVWSSARKIGFTATGLAVIVPLFVPTLTGGLFDGNGPGSGGNGDAVAISNPMVDMKRDLTRGADIDLLRIDTPERDPSYLRISVLDAFDGDAWRPSGRKIPIQQRAEGPVPLPPGLDPDVAHREVPYTIDVDGDFESHWLPTPYPIATIHAEGDWRYDTSTMDFISAAEDQTTANLSYRLRALDVEPTAAELASAGPAPASVFNPGTALPKDLPRSVRDLARQVTAQAPTKFEKAVALQNWFRRDGRFRYSLQRAPGNGMDELQKFLGTGPGSRVGYCEQFSAAMALMGRTLAIPSRVAVGFLRPDRVGPDTYVYSSHDLHAWPEMYFQGVGWVRFEPTPQDRATSVPAYTREQLPAAGPSGGTTSLAPRDQQNRIDQPSASPSAAGGAGGGPPLSRGSLLAGFAGVLGLLGLLALPRAARAWVRRRRWSTATTPATLAEAAWSEVRDTARDLAVPWDDSVTLRTRAHDLVRSFGRPASDDDAEVRPHTLGPAADPEATAALDRIVRLLERARYARAMPTAGSVPAETAAGVAADVALCVRALRAGAGRHRRTRAIWLPDSLTVRLGGTRRIGTGTTRGGTLASEAGVDHAV